MAVYDKEHGSFTVNYTSMEPRFLEIVENGLGHPLIKYTFARDKLNIDNLQYPTVLSNPAIEIQMLFANTAQKAFKGFYTSWGLELKDPYVCH